MTQPKLIPEMFTAQSNIIASYNYSDIAEGTGIVKFYGYCASGALVKSYGLTTTTPYSDPMETIAVPSTAGAYATDIDIDFDLSPFKFPHTIGGNAIVNIPAYTKMSGNGANGGAYVKALIRKYSGSTETEIVSNYSVDVKPASAGTAKDYCLDLDIPNTHFVAGDILRLTVQVIADKYDSDDGSSKIAIAHDPQDRDAPLVSGANMSTSLIFLCPFKLTEIGY